MSRQGLVPGISPLARAWCCHFLSCWRIAERMRPSSPARTPWLTAPLISAIPTAVNAKDVSMNKPCKSTSVRQFLKRDFWQTACASWVVRPLLVALSARLATLLAGGYLLGLAAYAQGTVNFANLGVGLN